MGPIGRTRGPRLGPHRRGLRGGAVVRLQIDQTINLLLYSQCHSMLLEDRQQNQNKTNKIHMAPRSPLAFVLPTHTSIQVKVYTKIQPRHASSRPVLPMPRSPCRRKSGCPGPKSRTKKVGNIVWAARLGAGHFPDRPLSMVFFFLPFASPESCHESTGWSQPAPRFSILRRRIYGIGRRHGVYSIRICKRRSRCRGILL